MKFEDIEELKPYIEKGNNKYQTNKNYKMLTDYYDSYIDCKINDKQIMYEAFYGRGITCNPGQLFLYLLNDPRFADYEHVWSLENSENREAIIAQYSKYKNVRFVEPLSKEYFEAISSSKYLINNVTWRYFVTKKEGQVIINTWHGIPLKHLGYDVPNGNIEAANMARNLFMSDYIISPVKYTTDNFRKAFKLEGLYDGKIIEAGYPRIDATVNSSKTDLKKELELYNIHYDENKKLILYAPTWRGTYGSPDMAIDEYDALIEKLTAQIDTNEYQILFKPHQVVYKAMMTKGCVNNSYVPAQINTNLLLGATDILISDYSSIFFDFLVTEKPILFYIPDLEEYKESRGLYLSVDELPGPVAQTDDELCNNLKNIGSYKDLFDFSKYTEAVERFVCNDDGKVCQKVIDAVFFDDDTNCVKINNNKKRILLHLDAILTNGISYSLNNLIMNLKPDKYDITFYSYGEKDIATKYLSQFPDHIRVLFRAGMRISNPVTDARIQYCNENSIVEVDNNPIFPIEFYQTEYNRCFGGINFDCIVNFSGFSAYYVNVYFTNKNCRQIIWMHNVMMSEYNRKANGKYVFKDKLDCIFKLYPYLDKYVSCSRTTMLQNREDLATNKTHDKFSYAKNTIDAQRVIDGLNNKKIVTISNKKYIYLNEHGVKKIIPLPPKTGLNFVTVGRLANGKNHKNLINAFARFNKKNPDSRLYIIGNGPNKTSLIQQIESLNLCGKIILTGNIDNPFAVMSECDCFILPSNYEGQPMVLLEARIIGLPIIVSNFATVDDSAYESGQLIIGMEEDDIYNSFVKFKKGKVPNEFKFDDKKYNEEAIAEFESNL